MGKKSIVYNLTIRSLDGMYELRLNRARAKECKILLKEKLKEYFDFETSPKGLQEILYNLRIEKRKKHCNQTIRNNVTIEGIYL